MEEHNGLLLTMWCFCYHLPTRTLTYCAAGHHAAYLVAPGNPEPEAVWRRSPAIGMMPTTKYVSGTIQVPEQARLYVFTDGCFELALANGEYWTQEGLRDVIMRAPVTGIAESRRIYQAVRGMARPGPFEDDFSMLVVTFN
jgi:sigma-B regulation protein RsbU (phosphoserine phosphatase)